MPFAQYCNFRFLIIFVMGFSSGLPMALCGSTLLAWYAVSGVDVVTIGMMALVSQPYVYKFLWAPFIDHFLPPFLGRRRGWILISQLMIVLTLCVMAFFEPAQHPGRLAFFAFFLAFFSATQDIAIDAYRTDLLQPHERGIGAAMGVAGYRIAMLVSGGVALIMADFLGWQETYLLMAACLALTIFATLYSPITTVSAKLPSTLREAVIEPFREFMSRKYAFALLALIMLYKLGDAFTSNSGLMTNVFLLKGLGFDLTTVGTVNKGVGLVATLVGVFCGGVLLMRISLFSALLCFGIVQASANLSFVWLAIAGKNLALLIVVVAFDNFSAGLGTSAVLALMMSLCDSRYTATQFALLTAIASIGRVIFGPIAGIMVSYLGWVQFFLWTSAICLPAITLLWWLRLQEAECLMRRHVSKAVPDLAN